MEIAGGLLASKRSLAFDWEMPMEPRVDRPELPLGLRQLEIDISGYKMEKWVHRH